MLLQELDKVLELEQHVLLQNLFFGESGTSILGREAAHAAACLDVGFRLAQAVEALQEELADLHVLSVSVSEAACVCVCVSGERALAAALTRSRSTSVSTSCSEAACLACKPAV